MDRCLTLAKYSQPVNEKIRERARELEKQGLRSMDALHLACAEAAETDCFLTCDDRIVKRYKGRTDIKSCGIYTGSHSKKGGGKR